jgi:hypothetical protein
VQLGGDACPVVAADQQVQYLLLARGEVGDQLGAARRLRAVRRQVTEQFARQPASVEHSGTHRADDLLNRRALGDETDRARAYRLSRAGDVRVTGQHHDHWRERQCDHLPGEVESAELAQPQVHDDGIRPLGRRDGDRLFGARRHHRLEIGLRREDSLHALTEDPVVVDDEDDGGHYPPTTSGAWSARLAGTSTIPSLTA